MNENWVAVIAILILFGGPIAWGIINRALTFVERVEMIKHGITPPPDARAFRRNRWYASGPVPPQAPPDPRFAQQPFTDYGPGFGSAEKMLRKGVVLAFIGLALTIGLSFIGYHDSGGPFGSASVTPGPWLLGGLIPLFIGVAQILLALMAGASFGRPAQNGFAPPPQTPQAGPYHAPTDEPIAPPPWTARPTYEELQRPAPPPDKR